MKERVKLLKIRNEDIVRHDYNKKYRCTYCRCISAELQMTGGFKCFVCNHINKTAYAVFSIWTALEDTNLRGMPWYDVFKTRLCLNGRAYYRYDYSRKGTLYDGIRDAQSTFIEGSPWTIEIELNRQQVIDTFIQPIFQERKRNKTTNQPKAAI